MNSKLAEAGSELDDYVSAPQMILYNFILNHWPDSSDMSDTSLNSLQSQVSGVITVSSLPAFACALLCKHAPGTTGNIRQHVAGLACACFAGLLQDSLLAASSLVLALPAHRCTRLPASVQTHPNSYCSSHVSLKGVVRLVLALLTHCCAPEQFVRKLYCTCQVCQAMAERRWHLLAPLLCSTACVTQPQVISWWAGGLLHAAPVAELPADKCCLVRS